MRVYELLFIVSPTEADEAVDALVEQVQGVAESQGATVAKIDRMGRRRLAYPIRKLSTTHTEGTYVVFTLEGSGREIAELERRLRVTESVIRHLTIRIDEDLKRAAKLQAKRNARAQSGGGRRSKRDSEREAFTETAEPEAEPATTEEV